MRLQMLARFVQPIARSRRSAVLRAAAHSTQMERLDDRVLLSSGDLDSTFRNGGKFTHDFGFGNDSGYSMHMLSDGRFLVAGTVRGANGSNDFGLARFLADGTLDTTFGIGGMVTTDFSQTSTASADEAPAIIVHASGRSLNAR